MKRQTGQAVAFGISAVLFAVLAAAQPRVEVSVRELTQREHRLEIQTGTEILWSDPHFESVWFPPEGGGPQVERTEAGFRGRFDTPGVYHGLYTIVGGHTSGDVYRMTVTVKPAAR